MADSRNVDIVDFLAGIPVTVGPEAIDRELTRLWKPLDPSKEDATAVTRACLSNIIFYIPCAASAARVMDLVHAVGHRLPSRMILLKHADGGVAACSKDGTRLKASVAAVCHLGAAGAPPICCEQITLEALDGSLEIFPGAVMPLLVPDVPVCLVVLSGEKTELAELLEDVVDRVIFDSRELSSSALGRAEQVVHRKPGIQVDDLAWRDTVAWRIAIREVFEDPAARSLLASVRSVEVRHVEGGNARAAAFCGWFASRLRRNIASRISPVREGGDPGQLLSVRLESADDSEESFLSVRRLDSASMLKIEYHTQDTCIVPRTIPFRIETTADLLGGALERATDQFVLLGALQARPKCESAPA